MSIHPTVLKEMESVGWIKRDETSYTPTERGKKLATWLASFETCLELGLAQAIDPSIRQPVRTSEQCEAMIKRINEEALNDHCDTL